MAGNEYDDLLEQLPAPTAPQAPPNPYDQVLQSQDVEQQQRLRTSLTQHVDTAPDSAAEALKISTSLNVPLEVVQRNLPDMQRRAQIVATPYRQILSDTPALASWAAEPTNAAVSHDDMEQLGALEWLLTMPSRAISQSLNEQAYGALRTKSIFQPLTQEEQDQLASYKIHAQMGGELGAGNSWFKGALTKTMKLLTTLTAPEAIPTAAGAAVGGTIGAAGGFLVAGPPGAVAGGIAGGKLGAEAGYTFGLGSSAFQTATASSLDDFMETTDAVGRKLDPEVAKALAVTSGAVNAGLMVLGGRIIASTIDAGGQQIASRLTRNMIKEAVRQPSVAAAIGEMMKTYGKTLTEGTALMVAMKTGDIITHALGQASGERLPIAGQLAPGNVDLFKQPAVRNADGTISTVDSFSVNVDGKEVLLPTVTPDGRHLDQAAALEEFQRTGRNLGTFDSPQSATAFAERLHEDYAAGKYLQPSIGSQLLGAAAEGVQSFALIGLAGPAMGLARDVRKAQQATRAVQFFQALGEGVEQSKTSKRLPDAAQAFVEHATKDGPIPTVYAPIETWTKYWQDRDVDPEAMATELTGRADAYEQARKTGEDLAIPTSRYATKLAATEHNAYFSNELRLGPEEMNGREAAKLIEEIKRAPGAAEEPAESPVRKAVMEQLTGAGVPEQTAEQYASLYESAFGSLAERAGVDPAQLYEQYGLKVSRPDLTPAGEEPGGGQTPPAAGETGGPGATGAEGGGLGLTGTEALVGRPGAPGEVERAAGDLSRPAGAVADVLGTVDPAIAAAEAEMRSTALPAGTKDRLREAGYTQDQIDGMNVGQADEALRSRSAAGKQIPGARPVGDYSPADLANEAQRVAAMAGASRAEKGPRDRVVDRKSDAAQNPENYLNAETRNAPAAEEGRRPADAAGQRAGADVRGDVQGAGDGNRAEPGRQTPEPRGIPAIDEVFRREEKEATDARLTPEVERNLRWVLEELQNFKTSGRTWDWLTDENAARGKSGNAAGGNANIIQGETGAPVFHDVIGYSPVNEKTVKGERVPAREPRGTRLQAEAAIEKLLETRHVTSNLMEGALRVAENRNAGNWRDLERPMIPPPWGEPVSRAFTDALSEAIDQADQPGNMLEEAGLEQDAVDTGGPGDTSFNIDEFSQSLFDALEPPDPTADTLTEKVDRLETGELQPRLPGAGDVRDQNVQTPEFEAPFSLTSEVAKPAKPRRERGPSEEYLAAKATADAASAQFAEATRAYRAKEIDDATYLEARKQNTEASAAFDAAFEKEQQRGAVTSLFQEPGPLDQQALDQFSARVKERFSGDLQGYALRLTPEGDIFLESLIVDRGAQRAGIGSDAMRELTRFADVHGRRITLTPAQPGDIGPGEPTSSGRLVRFYKRFGFVENKGRRSDPALSEGMYRDPSALASRELAQEPRGNERRGVIRFGPDRQFSVDLLERADLSTFLHESGHFFLEVFDDLTKQIAAVLPDARTEEQQHLLGDYQTLREWLTDEDHTGAGFSTKQHEQFARGFEAYLMEGKAPSVALATPFARFRAWLTGIYRSLTNLNVKLTPEVRGVMDRLLASDQAIKDAEAQRGVEPMFTTPESAGMEPAEFQLYARTVADAGKAAREALDRKLLAEVHREQTAEWKAQRAVVRSEVEQETMRRPEYQAISAMRDGTNPDGSPLVEGLETPPLQLSRQLLEERFGKDRVKRLPRGIVAEGEGVNPEMVASMYGYSSVDAMLTAVEKAPELRNVVERETRRRMVTEHGSILLDGSLPSEAQAAVANETRDAVIRAEMRALGRKRREVDPFVKLERAKGRDALAEAKAERDYERRWFEAEAKLRIAIAEGYKQVEVDALTAEVQQLKAQARGGAAVIRAAIPDAATVRAAALERVAGTKVRDLKPAAFWSASRRAGQQALEKAARQDFDGAITAKQQELINLGIYREMERAKADAADRARYAQGLTAKSARARIGLAGGSYLDQIDGVLDRYEFATVSQKALDRRAAIRDWAAGLEAQGLPVEGLSAELLNEARRINWKETTVAELQGITDGLKQIEHLARLKNRLLKATDKAEFDVVRDGVATSIRANVSERPRLLEVRPADAAKRTIGDYFASHRKLSSLAQWMDGHVDGGPMWEAFIRPINEAGHLEETRRAEAGGRYMAILEEHYPGRELLKLNDKMEIPAIGGSLSHEARIAVGQLWGTETGRERLTHDPYRRWTEGQVLAILDTLEKRDWDFIAAHWKYLDSFWPEIAAKQERVTGLAPEKVDPLPVQTKFGEYPGGYSPLAYDGRFSVRAGQNEAASQAKLTGYAPYVQSTTKRGFTETRVKHVGLPVRLEMSVGFQHIDEVLHDLTHHEMLIDVTRLLRDPKVSSAMMETAGDQVYQQFTRGIQDIAIGSTPAARNIGEKAANFLRQRTQLALLGLNLWTGLQQPLGMFNGMDRVGVKWVARGLGRWLRDAASMEKTTTWIAEVSPMMRERVTSGTQDLHDLRAAFSSPGGWFDNVVRTVTNDAVTKQAIIDGYLWHIGIAQRVADVPTWLGGYEKAMASPTEGRTPAEHESRAVALADQGVLDSQGGGQVKDLAQIQRGGPYARMFMTFYSYGNTVLNATARNAEKTNFRSPASVATFLGHLSLLYVLPALGTATLACGFGKKPCKDTGDFLAAAGGEMLSTSLNTLVYVRELASAAQIAAGLETGARGYGGPAALRPFEWANQLAQQVRQGKVDEGLWHATNNVAGVLFKYPAAQVQRTIDGWVALEEGRTTNPAALLVGPPPKAKGK